MTAAAVEPALKLLWHASWQASAAAALVLLVQWLLGARLSARARYALWAIVVLRLLLPVVPQWRFSLFNLARLSARHVPVVQQDEAELVHVADPVVESTNQSPAANPQAAEVRELAEPHRVPMPIVLGAIWVCGLLALSGHVVVSCRRLKRLPRSLTHLVDAEILEIVESTAQSLGLKRPPSVAVSEAVPTPSVVGVLRPMLLIPTRVLDRCDREELRLIVLHELAHVKRHDVACNWVVTLATIIHWFNPVVWLVAARVRADRELACDELVLSRSHGRDAQAYGRTLLKLIEILSPRRLAPQRQLMGILENWRPMQRRVRMIAQFNPGSSSSRWMWSSVLLLVLGCAGLTDAVHADNGVQPQPPRATTRQSPVATEQKSASTEAELQAALARVIPDLRLENVGFAEVIEFLRSASGDANIVIEWRVLEGAGVDRNTPVSINVRNVTLEQAMDHILRDVGGGSVRLDHMIDGGAIVISTAESLATRSRTSFYDVSDLFVGPDGKALSNGELAQKVDSLISIIEDSVAADSWKSHGGAVGSIKEFNGKLVIVTTPKIHHQIEQLLANLHKSAPAAAASPQAGTAAR